MLIVSCSHGKHLGNLIAKRLKAKNSDLAVSKFPDDELRVILNAEIKNKTVVFVQSFYRNISDCLVEIVLAAETARGLGAKKLVLVAPYFPYMRQDRSFHRGEAVSQAIIARLTERYFDKIYMIDPHLHREKNLESLFRIKAVKLTANSLIAGYIKKRIKNPVIVGPDEESYKWARNVARMIGAESRILKKKRYSSYSVRVSLNKQISLSGRNAVIVDDIVSTGSTILETAKILKRLGAKNIYCICIHGIFANRAMEKLKKAKITVISTNTIPNKAARMDVSGLVAENLEKIF